MNKEQAVANAAAELYRAAEAANARVAGAVARMDRTPAALNAALVAADDIGAQFGRLNNQTQRQAAIVTECEARCKTMEQTVHRDNGKQSQAIEHCQLQMKALVMQQRKEGTAACV